MLLYRQPFPGVGRFAWVGERKSEEAWKVEELPGEVEVASSRSQSSALKSKLQARSVYLGQGRSRSMICKVDLLLPCLPWQSLRAAHWLPPQMSTVWTHTYTNSCTHTHVYIHIYLYITVRVLPQRHHNYSYLRHLLGPVKFCPLWDTMQPEYAGLVW